ncbi:uncharacterized protein moto [Dunckerocampus dactyliophorus]|uniref:uncharacterized protein moto n=1 Tax=Dunckerocampus dactyliophorus TaxID=161453 RepID=UPI002404A93E|nr:uncharacterized protein moto [Dunckerocampus dactyliophorus]
MASFTRKVQRQDVPDMGAFTLWSRSGHNDSYELKDCVVNSIKSREIPDRSEAEEETDLQGLVSNILDEGGVQSRNSPTGSSLWCTKSSTEEFSTYFQSENTQDSATFLPNYVPSEAFLQGQVELAGKNGQIPQQPNGSSANQQWHVCVPNGDRDSLFSPPWRLPPGLPILKTGNHILSQMSPSEYDLSADLQQANHWPVNDFPQISDVFQQQSEMCSSLFDLYSEGHCNGRSAKPMTNTEQYLPEDMNQLVIGFKSPMADEPDRGHSRGFPNMQIKTEHPEESMAGQWKIPIQTMPPVHTQKQLEGELWSMTRGRNGKVGKPTFKHHNIQGLSGFGNENEYFLQTKPNVTSLNPPNQYQNRINRNMHQFSNHRSQQHKMKPQMQKERKRMSGSFGERPQINSHVTENYKTSHSDLLLNMQRAAGEDSMGGMLSFIPLVYAAGDSWLPVKSQANLTSSYTVSKGSSPSGMTTSDMMSNHGAAALYAQLNHSKPHTGESYGMGSALAASLEKNQGMLMMQLYLHLDECYEQWRYLEKEWKKTEVILAKTFPGEWKPPSTSTSPPGSPANPLRVEDLIFNQKREQSRVECLLFKMECVCNVPLHANICMALNNHHTAMSCISELVKVSQRQRDRGHLIDDRDTMLLVMGLKELAASTRKLRTALWCALQMCLPEPINRPDHQVVNREETHTHRCLSPPNVGYSFRI